MKESQKRCGFRQGRFRAGARVPLHFGSQRDTLL